MEALMGDNEDHCRATQTSRAQVPQDCVQVGEKGFWSELSGLWQDWSRESGKAQCLTDAKTAGYRLGGGGQGVEEIVAGRNIMMSHQLHRAGYLKGEGTPCEDMCRELCRPRKKKKKKKVDSTEALKGKKDNTVSKDGWGFSSSLPPGTSLIYTTFLFRSPFSARYGASCL